MTHPLDGSHYFADLPLAPVPPQEVIRQLREALADLPFIWRPLVPLGPVILRHPRHRELTEAAGRLLGLLRRTLHELGPDSRSRARALGMDARLDELLVDQRTEDSFAAWMSRPDVIPASSGFKFIEFNVSATVGGPAHNHALRRAWYSIYGEAGGTRPPFAAADPFAVRTRYLDRLCDQLGGDRSIALIEESADYMPSHAVYDAQVDFLTRQGYRVICRLPEQIAELAGREAGSYTLAMKLLVPQDLLDEGSPVSTVRQACQIARLALSPQSSYQVANKKLLGLLSAGPGWLPGGRPGICRQVRSVDSDNEIRPRGVRRPSG